MISQDDIDNWFSYHEPTMLQKGVYNEIRLRSKEFAEFLNLVLPDCPDKTVVFRKLREVVMCVNQTIACNSKVDLKSSSKVQL